MGSSPRGSFSKTKLAYSNFSSFSQVSQVKDLDMLLMHNQKFAVEIAGNVSSKKRRDIVAKAETLGLRLTNKFARVQNAES